MLRLDPRFGLVLVLVCVIGACSPQSDPRPESATTLPEVEDTPPVASFFFPQAPLAVDVPTPTVTQRAELDSADVAVGTQVLVATSSLEGSSSGVGEIQITDVMRGAESEQEIQYVLVGPDGQSDAVVRSVNYDICKEPDSESVVIRGSSEACVRSVNASTPRIEAAWIDNGIRYVATSQVAASPMAFIEWLDNLESVELGSDGPPYSSPYCSEAPDRCD
jgi:hypothetical protein